jgi:hypothetical protein
MIKTTVILVFLLATASRVAFADCEYKGKYYPTGTKIGTRVCQADGTWR